MVKGEALALRAMLHFDMLRLFGPVYSKDSDKKAIPYYTKQTNTPEPILTAEEVAGQVAADLEDARTLLANDPVKTEGTLMSGAQDGTSNFMRYRALRLNYYAVEALLARVCLYMGDKKDAFKYASDVIKTADHIIDLGPEGGSDGGTIVAEGTPEEVAKCKKSYTGQFLAKLLK